MTRDLTAGHPLKIIVEFAIPVFFGYLFQQLYNVVDTIIVGRFLGVQNLAAVGSTGSLHFLIMGFCIGLCSGFAIPVAQKFGAGDYKTMRSFVFNSYVLLVFFSVVLTVLTLFFCRPLLTLLKTPSDVLEGADDYFGVILKGIPVVLFYNLLASIIRSVGDSKTPLYFLVLSAVLNIILDLLFIAVFDFGVKGAASATVIAQAVSMVLCWFYMQNHFELLRLKKEDCILSKRRIQGLLGAGLPMGLQYSITAIGSVILQSAVNALGSVFVAAMATGQKISMFFSTPFDSLGTTMATYAGQNVGAHKIGRLNRGLFWACLLGAVYSIMALCVLYFFSNSIISLFMDQGESASVSQNVIQNARFFLLCNGVTYFLLALVNIVRFMIQGMGFSKTAVFAGIFELIGRSTIGVWIVPLLGFKGACLASPLAWVLADAFLIPAFFYCQKKLKG